jgi:hypothetical protein
MFEPIAPLITAIRNAGPPIYAAALAASLLLLFLPEPFIAQLGLATFRQSHRTELGVVLIASASLLVIHAAFATAPVVKRRWITWRFQRGTRTTLANLTVAEKQFIRPYIVEGENTRYLSIYDGVANGLEAKNIVYKASHVTVPGRPGMLCPFNLQPYARTYLNKKPELLK